MTGAGRRLARDARALWATVRGAPGTLSYLISLLVTQLTLTTVDEHIGHRLLLSESTNLFNMRRAPVQVLIGSAFWIDETPLVTALALVGVVIVLAPLERWLGVPRWLAAIAGGHLGATLLTLVATTSMLRHGLLEPSVAHSSDVGVSYILLTALGLLVYRLTGRTTRFMVAALGVAVLGTVLGADHRIVDLGHLLSFLIGLALYPLIPAPRRTPSGHAGQAPARSRRQGVAGRGTRTIVAGARAGSQADRERQGDRESGREELRPWAN